MQGHMLLIDGFIGHFITNNKCIAFATALLPAINRGVARQEVEGQFIGFVVCATAAAFEKNVAQMLVHLDTALELSDLERNTITCGISQCAEKNLWILNIALDQ